MIDPQTATPAGELVFATTDPVVVGCTAQAVAAATIMGVANNLPEDHPASDWLFDNSESVAGSILRGLGIDSRARGILSHAKEQAAGVDHLAASIAEVMAEDGGCWRPCSGCQESVDGCVSYTDYPYSETFKCQPGAGCGECGGIGVLWEDGAFLAGYADLALDDDDDTPAPASSVGEGMVLVPAEMPRAMMDAGQDYINSVAFMGSHVLPAQFRWVDFWSAILAAAPDVRVGTSGCLRNALVALLDTSGARGTYHALKYAEAVENAERILASTPDRAPAPADLVEAFEQAHALIQEAKGLADGPQGGSVTDHLDFAEHWLAKAEELALAALRSPDDLAKGRGK